MSRYAITGIAPRGLFCEALAGVVEGLGEAQLALAWTQRWVALRPGCPRAIATLQDTYKEFDQECAALQTELSRADAEVSQFLGSFARAAEQK